MRTPCLGPRRKRSPAIPAVAAGVAIAAWLAGCAANDPYDPASVPNTPPTARLFVGPVTPGGELNPTSYYQRTFRWSGTDVDGWVREYYVSIRTQAGVEAPWDTTTRTDTTMTFSPDDQGLAEATLLVACRDDRGAVSDTVIQYIPLRNFPPAVNFQSDYNPLRSLQRELIDAGGQVTTNPSAAVDTNYFNWGAMSFRMFALDLDGASTMDDFYRYTLADGDGDALPTWDAGEAGADPNLGWVRVPFNSSAEIKKFSITVRGAAPGETRTLRVSVKDEAESDANFSYSWEVRAPRGPVLFIGESLTTNGRNFLNGALDAIYGAGGWDQFSFWFGWPDSPGDLLETFRSFDAVVWADGGAGSLNIRQASASGGVLNQYMVPLDASDPGRVLFLSRGLVGAPNGLSNAFLISTLGVSPTGSPATALRYPAGKLALHQAGTLPDMATAVTSTAGGIGLARLTGADNEILYRMEYCECYGDPRRPSPPYDPIVGIRVPSRATAARARFAGLSVQIENFNAAQATAVIGAILEEELGVTAP